LAAAIALARRRGLGPYRKKEGAAVRDKDVASLARAGFSYDIARKVVDADDPDLLLSAND
jgi:regulatory protein